nr:DUF6273 domain-containing protein [uncultured Acetatifactor sp.]
MEELKVRAGNEELKVKGNPETIQREREAFYQHIKEVEEGNIKEKVELEQRMKSNMAWYARAQQEKDAANAGNPGVARICGELQGTWEEIASAIKSGAEFKVGDYKKGSTADGQGFTLVVTDVADEYVRFESRDCVGEEAEWNKNGGTQLGYPGSDIHKYMNKGLFERLPEDLRKVISLAERKMLLDGETVYFNTYLFLPAASEVFGEGDCYGDKGLYGQMEYYMDRRNRMRGSAEGEDTESWWLASVGAGGSAGACFVTRYGHASYWDASNASRVPVCFIIKKA